jgi:betaine-aldehyde dehydrogenase
MLILQAAAEGIAVAGFFNAGQDCTAATRVIVQEGVYDEMVKLLAAQATDSIAMGMPSEDVHRRSCK